MNRILFVVVLCFLVVSSASAAPATATVSVDCNLGQTINNALNHPADELTIEISGICVEDVEITRTNVTLRGADPFVDGISSDPAGFMRQALTLRNTSIVNIENLKLTGASNGIGINDSFGVHLTNCRLEDNEFAGAIVGTGSASVYFWDTVVAAPNPPEGARLSRGIWVTNGSSATCNNCTISDYARALYSTTGGRLFVNGGSIAGTGTFGDSLQVSGNAAASINGATLNGRIRVSSHGIANLRNTTQISSERRNDFRWGSNFIARGSTTLFGDAWVSDFSKMTLSFPSSMSGALTCFRGGDAYCDDPWGQTGNSNCGQCPNP